MRHTSFMSHMSHMSHMGRMGILMVALALCLTPLAPLVGGMSSWEGPPCTLSPPLAATLPTPPSSPLSTAIAAAVDNVHSTSTSAAESGLEMAIAVQAVYNQQTLFHTYAGTTTPGTSIPPSADSVFHVGSVTKVATSMLYAAALEKGYVHADTPLSSLFSPSSPPAFTTPNPWGTGEITLGMLASHTSGLPRSYAQSYGSTQDDIFELLDHITLLFPPQTRPHYSNLGITLLGHAVARAWPGDATYEDLMESVLFDPIGMETASFNVTGSNPDALTGYSSTLLPSGKYTQAKNPNTFTSLGYGNPDGGLWASPADLNAFLKATFASLNATNDDHTTVSLPLSYDTVRQYFLPSAQMAAGVEGYGAFTWEIHYVDGEYVYVKPGLVSGFTCYLAIVPSLGLGVAAQINSDATFVAGDLSATTVSMLIKPIREALAAEEAIRVAPLPPGGLMPFLGSYAVGDMEILNVTGIENGRLVASSPVLAVPGIGVLLEWLPLVSPAHGVVFSYSPQRWNTDDCLHLAGSSAYGLLAFSPNGTTVQFYDYGAVQARRTSPPLM